jgi:ligand-binding SRPBCC domain-containing protein
MFDTISWVRASACTLPLAHHISEAMDRFLQPVGLPAGYAWLAVTTSESTLPITDFPSN